MKIKHYDANGKLTGYSVRSLTAMEWIAGWCLGFFGPIVLVLLFFALCGHRY
jgi:hypothetical protein